MADTFSTNEPTVNDTFEPTTTPKVVKPAPEVPVLKVVEPVTTTVNNNEAELRRKRHLGY